MSKRHAVFLLAASIAVQACGPEEPSAPPPAPAAESVPPEPVVDQPPPTAAAMGIPARIVAERGGFIPEGVEFDMAHERFLTGSLSEGTIFEIGNDGSVTPFVEDPELVSTVGIEVDEPRDRLIAANSDFMVFQGGSQGQAEVAVFNLTTGERIAIVDAGAALGDAGEDAVFFANDVTVADDGEIFATDTRMNVVYRVDNAYNASVLHRFEPMEGLTLNGLVHHPDGYLLVVSLGNGALYKVPVDNPSATAQVTLPEPLAGADGMLWDAEGRLVVVSNSTGMVTALSSDDAWASAEVAAVATYEGQATTGAAVGSDVYIVQPHFADQDPPTIERVTFR